MAATIVIATAAEEPRQRFDFPAGNAAITLRQFAEVSGREILYAAEVVRGVKTMPVHGEFTVLEALQRMLANTNLQAIAEEAIAVRRIAPSKPAYPMSGPAAESKGSQLKPNEPPSMKKRTFFAIVASWLGGGALVSAQPASEQYGTLSGSVSNVATGNLLMGAKVAAPQLNLAVFTDNTGRYVLAGVPPGAYEVVVSYIGLDAQRAAVTLRAGERTVRNFDLTSPIYAMEAFEVTGEREGFAAAITEKRNAGNVKDVVAMDQFGNLPNLSVGEVVMRLPGVSGTPSDEGISGRFMVRGMDAALNTVTIDGSQMTTQGLARNAPLGNINATMFESIELSKGQKPDEGADSLGGRLNLKTRSTLTMREKRRITYNFVARIAPSFFDQIPQREQHRSHPLTTLSYQEVFDVLGGSRNLGVALNLSYSEYAVGTASTLLDYQNTVDLAAYIWDFSTYDNYNNRKQMSVNLKTEYRWSNATKITAGFITNLNFERFRQMRQFRAFTGNATTVPNATTTGVVPGAFTATRTVVRPVAAANIDILSWGPLEYNVRMRQGEIGAEHDFGRLRIDYTASAAATSVNDTTGDGGSLTMRLSGAGWILDRSQSDEFPQFLPNGGPDFTNPDNYRPAPNGLSKTNNQQDQLLRQARLNVKYQLPISIPLSAKAGFAWRDQDVETWGKDNHRWNYIGTGPLAADPDYVSYYQENTGLRMPQWLGQAYLEGRQPRDPALWSEDRYFNETQKFTATRGVREAVTAGYVMAQGKVGRTGFLGGVRVEKTETESWGWVRARQLSTTAQQTADPVGSAARDYEANYRELHGTYTKSFPSVHAFHDLTSNLKARLSWSTGFGRAGLNEFLPAETPNEANRFVTINNPGLKPQMASNWDAMIEYYFEPVGSFTVGWFHKTIRDFILRGQEVGIIGSGADNGYNGEYVGWSERTSINSGTAVAQGWELSFQQQFTFLPGLLKGLAASANYTRLIAHGDYGGTTYLTSRELPGFVPYTANASLSWRYRSFSTRVLYNFTSEHIASYNAASPALNLYRQSYKPVNLGVAYQVRPSLSLSLDVMNVLNEPMVRYRGFKNRTQQTISNFVTITAGVNGRF